MTAQGLPLGFLDAQCWARNPAEFGKNAHRHGVPIEQKERYRWIKSYRTVAAVQQRNPQLTLVSLGDREADIYELFAEAASDPAGPKLLIRAKHDRALQGEPARLFETIHAQPICGYQIVKLPRQTDRPARLATLAIRFAAMNMCPPQDTGHRVPIAIWAVLAQEEEAPTGTEPVEWRLLTTIGVENFEQACEKVTWHTQRWGLEVFHRTLKSGCRIEDRQLGHGDRLEACLAIDMVVAWRIYYLVKLGREVSHVPCDIFLDKDAWQVLACIHTKNKIPPAHPPPIGDAHRTVARLGGFMGRKSDGEPGTETMWRGLQRLDAMKEVWCVMWLDTVTASWRSMASGP